MTAKRVAVIAGDGVGPEVIAEAIAVVKAADVGVSFTELPWGSEHWRRTGSMAPVDALETLRTFDAILLGAIGAPHVPDHVSLWELLLAIRQGLDLWANIRPVRLLPGIPTPLAGRSTSDIDMLFVRENTEGEYAGVGGRAHRGFPIEVALETAVFTRAGVERVVRFAFQQARTRRGCLTSATKSNASRHAYVMWDEVVDELSIEFSDVKVDRMLVDALAYKLVRDPTEFDVVVASNLFGDILTDLAGALQGGLGMCASANLAPGGDVPGMFEPIHGSAPDIAGLGTANPCGAIWSAALMLADLGEAAAAEAVMHGLIRTCETGPRTADVGGAASTSAVGAAIVAAVEEARS